MSTCGADVAYYSDEAPDYVASSRLQDETAKVAALAPVIAGPLGMNAFVLFNPVGRYGASFPACPELTAAHLAVVGLPRLLAVSSR